MAPLMQPILNCKYDIIFSPTLFYTESMFVISVIAADLLFMLHADLIVIVTVFIDVIHKAYPRANEKHWNDGNYDDIP